MEKDRLVSLVNLAKQGDSDSMDALFSEYYNDVYYFALKTVKDSETACDITQETFLEIIRTIDKLQEPAAFETWMKKITYHQCTRYFKKKKDILVDENEDGNTIFDTIEDESQDSVPQEVYEKDEFRQTIMDMVDTLSEQQRSAVMLYYFDELPVGKIAEIQDVSEGTVKSRLNYARKAIKQSVEAYEKKHGIKLHSIAFCPLFLLGFGKKTTMPLTKIPQMTSALSKATSSSGSAAKITTASVKAVSKSTGFVAKVASLPIVTKVIAAVAAVSLLGGSVALGVSIANGEERITPVASPYNPTTNTMYNTQSSLPETQLQEVDYELHKDAIDGGNSHLVAVKADGSVIATGNNDFGQCDVTDWRDIVAVDAGNYHTAGLTKYGTVVATGKNDYQQCDVSEWRNIKAISAGGDYTLGLKDDGTVEVSYSFVHGDGYYSSFVRKVENWTDIVEISGSSNLVVGVKSDGTVVWAGNNFDNGVKRFENWNNIIDVDTYNCHCIALKSDGTVTSDGVYHYVQGDLFLSELNGIEKVIAGDFLKVGLKADGTVMTESVGPFDYDPEPIYQDGYKAAQKIISWTDIDDIYSGNGYVIGIKADGSTVIAVDEEYRNNAGVSDTIPIEASQWKNLMTTKEQN